MAGLEVSPSDRSLNRCGEATPLPERMTGIEHMASHFEAGRPAEHAGFKHTLYRHNYQEQLDSTRFAGGSAAYSSWLGRDDLFGALRHFGLSEIVVGKDEPDHVNGPSMSFVARRPGA